MNREAPLEGNPMKKTNSTLKDQSYFDFMIGISLILTIAFICFIFQGTEQIYRINEIRNQGTYTIEKEVFYYTPLDEPVEMDTTAEYWEQRDMSDYADYLEKLCGMETGNLFMYIDVRLGKAALNDGIVVLIKQNEPLKYPLKSGRYWENGSNEKNTVVIGTGVLKSTYLTDEKRYLIINDEPYEVIGVLEDPAGDKADSRIFANYQYISDVLKNELAYRGPYSPHSGLLFISDYSDVDKEITTMTEWCNQYYPDRKVMIMDASNEWDFGFFIKLLKYFMLGLIIFALYNSCIIAKLLFERYKRDLIIMRAFGLGDGQIIWYFYHKVWLCYGIGIMGALLVFRKPQFLLPAAGLFFLFMLTTIVPIINILRNRSIRKIGTNLFEVI